MFCHKCGTQIAEGSAFCQKCGTKVVYDEDAAQPAEQAVVSVAPVAAAPMRSTNTMTNQDNFKEFVDNHIQATTKFRSAEDLLKNSKPQMFLWLCFGIPAVIGLVAGGPVGSLLFGLVFGHTARWIAGGIIRNKES